MQIQITPYPTEILTADYQILGDLLPRGNPNIFINDQTYQTLTLHEATIKPVMAGAKLGPMNAPDIHIPKAEVHVLHIRDFTATEAQILPNKIRMICFTSTYVIRGSFHTGPETKASDIFYATASVFYPATDIEVFPLRALSGEVGLKADLGYVSKFAVTAFYEQQE
jgi:hypothetical protein